MADQTRTESPPPEFATSTVRNTLSPAAKRALAEAEIRRLSAVEKTNANVSEIGGRGGPDPVRYGDWEVKGLTSDF